VSKKHEKTERERRYLGIDVGGTKVLAALVAESGMIVARERCRTPRDSGPEPILVAIETAIDDLLNGTKTNVQDLTAIGIAIPGVVDPDEARVVVTPNMGLTGTAIGPHLSERYDVPIAVGNDGNLGALGERWLGSGRDATSVLSMCVGTGIGCGIVHGGELWRGAREAAGEIGHIVMEIGGPLCGCGNHGCFEALAGRAAIERDLRAAIEGGRTSILPELAEGDLSVIRSSTIRRALEAGDELVGEVMQRASEIIGYACLTVRHLLDPEVIVLGGGVIEACSGFMMPIIEEVVGSDKLPGARQGGRVLLSALGDDAVVLGAVALARQQTGRSPFDKQFAVKPTYAEISQQGPDEVAIGEKAFKRDFYVTVNGKARKRKKSFVQDDEPVIAARELEKVCEGGPAVLFVGTGKSDKRKLGGDARRYLDGRAIAYEELPTADAIKAYNKSKHRKAALIRLGK